MCEPEIIDAFYQGLEGLQIHGLVEIAAGIQLLCERGGQNQGGNGLQIWILFNVSQHFTAIHPGKIQVQQNEVGARGVSVDAVTMEKR